MRQFFILLLTFFIHSLAFATEIQLKNGVLMEGNIVELTSDYVKIEKDNHITYRLKFEDIDEASLAILKTLPQIQEPNSEAKLTTPLANAPLTEVLQVKPTVIETQPIIEPKLSETIANVQEKQVTHNEPPTVQSYEKKPPSAKTNDLQQNIVRSSSVQLLPTSNTVSANTSGLKKSTKISGIYILFGFIAVFFATFILHAILLGIPLHTIAKKTNTTHAWIAFIPIVNNFTMCAIAGKPWWWALLLLLPILGIAFYVVLWMKISEIRHQSKWLGFLFLVPIINIIFVWFLSFDPKVKLATPPQESSSK